MILFKIKMNVINANLVLEIKILSFVINVFINVDNAKEPVTMIVSNVLMALF